MKTNNKTSHFICLLTSVIIAYSLIFPTVVFGQKKILVFDTYHGQNPGNGETFNKLLPPNSRPVEISSKMIGKQMLKKKHSLVIFSPTKPFQGEEKQAIIKFLKSGGSMLLIFDEERRTPMNVGVNDFIRPFGLELTGNAPVRHNCGAIADSSEVCARKREMPYSGGRSITGGKVISRVNDEGNYVHSAYTKLRKGGKLIVMSDGMAGLLMGMPNGERFSGTNPSDSKYWGKDSKIFMQEILKFLVEK
ncbi:MAG TPA: hypothetical protein VGB63_12005 [Pedobacter sp.]|jgi:hypothetical protein